MYLEHVNLVVDDIEQALHFYQAAFPHWRVRSEGQGSWHGKPRNWLHFGDDYHYIAFSDHGEGVNRELSGHSVGLAHFAYVVQSIDTVITRLNQAGYPVDKDGAQHPHRKNVYFIDPAGFEVEFVEYLSDLPAERNSDA
ncbi:VOC family protein [Pseudoalteromonas sp. R3]|jgi:catechol 2,3-dioxygenase-like lactoylglutathione lyase family enzyme|uniref:VOC family protein n=1 Tax=Pseudoalteromonas sp. R3 TaxID=1709477 RepID=UPI0006B44001|nr:VOC family protein [Pseudoalteromonas sp. R3]AZZ96251.1 VOC family protein [Pseudoalteromonas sp. R3]